MESARPYLLSKVKYEDEVEDEEEDEEGEDDEDSSCELLLVAAYMGPKAVPLCFSTFSCFTPSLLPHAFSVSTALK